MEQSSIVAKRLWQVVRAVFYMLRVRGISKKKFMLDFHLFVDRSKLASKSFIYHLTHHNHRNSTSNKYNSREVEFSCSNTPSYPSFHLPKRKANNHHKHRDNCYDPNNYFYNFDAKEIAKALEVLNGSDSPYAESPLWSIGKSPAPMTRHLRITDSPFPVIEEEGGEVDKEIDMEAEEFIRKFYEQLRSQPSVPATPVYTLRS
ncbi:Avr9/Cf-9 rapidly elicited protein [Rhynchospora pubera]|uniref:Avr9/Cf-9 rapidly elicited protein n=1 Tax=Rhynchospora pubera TaxID=906938 RepID=A0AAV8FE38_9POAL|nr:Avr9/Cf-9 rapidly elicited protein [Rhynchospora pubera]KAJ4808545.1 Avr9/Cf-9 rapidly elicited protein [Rhynchospora pubera]